MSSRVIALIQQQKRSSNALASVLELCIGQLTSVDLRPAHQKSKLDTRCKACTLGGQSKTLCFFDQLATVLPLSSLFFGAAAVQDAAVICSTPSCSDCHTDSEGFHVVEVPSAHYFLDDHHPHVP